MFFYYKYQIKAQKAKTVNNNEGMVKICCKELGSMLQSKR